MKSTALIHIVKSVAADFDDSPRNYLGYEVKIHNLWDDLLTNNPNGVGELTIQSRNRLLCDVKAQELAGADIIVTICSTPTPAVELTRLSIRVSVIAIGDAMTRRSVLYGKHIAAIATAESTIGPTVSKIKIEAGKTRREVDVFTCMCMDAFHAMKVVDVKKHDMILREEARELKGYDCIMFARVSMTYLEDETASITGYPVFTSPRLCMEEIKSKLEEIQKWRTKEKRSYKDNAPNFGTT